MSERDNPGNRSGRQPAEGVRIIKAEEAQAALEAGEAAGRRPDDQLRFGDVPPAPSGPRPAHRFPLPDSVDPAEAVSLPPLATPAQGTWRRPTRNPQGSTAGQPGSAASDDLEDFGDERYPDTADDPAGYADTSPRGSEADGGEYGYAPEPVGFELGADRPASGGSPAPGGGQPDRGHPGSGFEEWPASERGPSGSATSDIGRPASGPAPHLAGDPPLPPPPSPRAPGDWAAQTETATRGDDQMEADAPPWAVPGGFSAGSDSTTELAPAIPEEGITVSGGTEGMLHWSDPPTGEVPRLRFDEDAEEDDDPDQLAAWRALGTRGVRWRDDDAWDEGDELGDLVPESGPVGALDQNRTEHSDLYSFDDDFERVTNRTGANPVVDLTVVEIPDDHEPDDEWDTPDTGASRAARRGRRWDRGRSGPAEASGGRRSARAAFGAAGAAGTAGAAGSAATASAAGASAGAAAASAAGSGAGSAGGFVGGGAYNGPSEGGFGDWAEPAPAAAAVGASATRRVSTSTATRDPSRRVGPDRPGAGPPRRPPTGGGGGGEVGNRVVVGVGLVVVLFIAYAIGAKALVLLSAVVVVAAAAEAYNMTRAPGFRPATLLGLVATVGCVLGAYWKGIGAIPIVTVLLFAGTMLWYVLGVVEARPLANAAVTVMVFVWVSVMGSFSAVLLQAHSGKGLFLGAILVAIAADIFAFVVGRWIGSRPMAAAISPNKTIEGFVGGLVGAIIVGAIVGKVVHPWSGMRYGLVLGLVIGLIAPAGDLFESMLKRDLGIKDSGTVLGGHGGLLDRFDSILLALPAAYFVATLAHVV
ncbi:MAG: phosphatidate cytidylyltransferase [Acidobacteriota bacterium]|nr:phosphatidate cytidylyltransferase [Acidobacteriota bacterium]